MNIKSIIYGCIAVSIAAGGVVINKLQNNNKATYTPRNAQTELAKDQEGYINYLNSLRANQITGEIDPAEFDRVKQDVLAISKKNNKASLGMVWNNQGPDNVGGRTRALLVDRFNSNIVYAGSIAGGLYVSNDGASSWTAVGTTSGFYLENTAISSITQTASGRIFFSTGSPFESNKTGTSLFTAGFVGNGVYEYIPSSGTVVPILTQTSTLPNNSTSGALATISEVKAFGERLFVGSNNGLLVADPVAGSYPSTQAGWTNPVHVIKGNPLIEQGAVQDIDIHANGSAVICFASKVYHSFNVIDPNLALIDDSFTRVSISGSRLSASIAPSDPNYIYVVASSGTLNGLYLSRTFDGNNAPVFDKVIPGGSAAIDPFRQNDGSGAQAYYDQCIAADPANRERCIVGGVQLYEFNLTPTSVPLGGDWVKIAHLQEFLGYPGYVHADKHNIIWNGSTVYIVGDGGIAKSVDNGASWTENSYGYNTATFFSVATNALGWVMGGAQDNGNQLVAYGALGTVTPLGAVEVLGGDGFDCEFSNFGGGIAFNCSQEGVLTRSSAGGQGGTFFDGELEGGSNIFNTTIGYWESWNDPLTVDSIQITFDSVGTLLAGQVIQYTSLTNNMDLYYTVPTTVAVDTTDTIMLPDYIQHKMAYYSPGPATAGVYVTRQAASLGATSIDWALVGGGAATPDPLFGGAYTLEFSPDGNTLFAGTSGGSLYRIDNLSMANDSLGLDVRSPSNVTTCTKIANFSGRMITGIAIDPNNGNNVIVTLGNYSNSIYIYRTTTALTDNSVASGTGSFVSIQGPASSALPGFLPKMPIYDAEIDLNDKNKVIIGTEWGVWGTDNAFTASPSAVKWTEENTNIGHVPVFEVRQQSLRGVINTGMYYLGSHGKGFWSSSSLVTGVEDVNNNLSGDNNNFVTDLNVYPNPLNNVGVISFDLQANAKTVAKIYNLTGSLVKTIDMGMLSKGNHKEKFNASSLSIGTYIVSVESGNEKSVAKFIVTR